MSYHCRHEYIYFVILMQFCVKMSCAVQLIKYQERDNHFKMVNIASCSFIKVEVQVECIEFWDTVSPAVWSGCILHILVNKIIQVLYFVHTDNMYTLHKVHTKSSMLVCPEWNTSLPFTVTRYPPYFKRKSEISICNLNVWGFLCQLF